MARILLSEGDADVRALLQAVLVRSGHECLALTGRADDELPAGDLLVAEPAYGDGLRHARALRRRHPALAVLFVSILPPERAFAALRPTAHLVKPFAIATLERAVAAALDA